ncbi:hypothetical protein CU097_014971 [Rhizopus azygosporus]|uniref:Uncharacterized protein n=1 Tax=Rhizopus azygosporus TaxID=86630 RepID=A0A367KDF6_RHIAZ|nr:hypothetical protein CU097_014971 [Rhizopus azygosporus]
MICQKFLLLEFTSNRNNECTKIDTAYKNAVALQFGSRFRMFLNQLTGQKERIKSRKQELYKEKKSKKEINDIIYKEITELCKRLKLTLASGNTQNLPTGLLDDEKVSHIRQLFSTYGSNYKFKNRSIYYDCKTELLNHLKAYYTIAKLCEQSGRKSLRAFL